MAELRNLLSFMDAEDRDRALRRYDARFDAVGREGEEALIASFGSPVRQVLSLEKEFRQAQQEGRVPFADAPAEAVPVITAEPAVPGTAEGADDLPVPEEVPEDLTALLHAAADSLEPPEEPEPPADAADMDAEQLPIEGFLLFPDVTGEEPERFDLDGPDAGVDAPVDSEPEAAAAEPEESASAVETAEDVPAEADEPAEAAPATEPEEAPAESGEASAQENADEAEEPVFVEVPVDPGEEKVSVLSEQLDLIAYEAPEQVREEAVPIHDIDESAQLPEPVPPKKTRRTRDSSAPASPGFGRVLAAVLVTIPFIVLWIVCFAVSIALGLGLMAVGFVFCMGGVYLAGYVFGGQIGFMPDMLLVAGGALVCFALALLFIWTGLWIAVGGCAAAVHFTSGVYRRILHTKAPRRG